MRKLVRSLLIVLGLCCAAAILSHFTGPQASAVALIPVQVTNTKTAPAYVDAERPARNGFGATCYIPDVDPSINEATCTLLSLSAGDNLSPRVRLFLAGESAGRVPPPFTFRKVGFRVSVPLGSYALQTKTAKFYDQARR